MSRRQTAWHYMKRFRPDFGWNTGGLMFQPSIPNQHVGQKLAHRAYGRGVVQNFCKLWRGIRVDISTAHSHSKGSATGAMYTAGNLGRLARQVRINELHLTLAHKQKRFPDNLFPIRTLRVELQNGKIIEAELC